LVLQAYFDESTTEKGDFILAGFIASDKKWNEFSQDWVSLLKDNSLEKFKSVKLRKKQKVRESFFRLIEDHIEHCAFCVVKTGELNKILEEHNFDNLNYTIDIKKRFKNPYHHAVKNLLVTLSENINLIGLTTPYKVIFDDRTEKNSVISAYEYLKFSSPKNLKELLPDSLNFKSDDLIMPLQAADLFAYELRRSHESGINLRDGNMFPWSVKKGMKCFYTYLNGEFLKEQLEYVLSEENRRNFLEYIEYERQDGNYKDIIIDPIS